MPFTNPILGGNGVLVRDQIMSSNYVTGVSGWIIKADGTAEFSDATLRGSLTVSDAGGTYEDVIIEDGVISFGDTKDGGLIYGYDNHYMGFDFPTELGSYDGHVYLWSDDGASQPSEFAVYAEKATFQNPGGVNPPDITVTIEGDLEVTTGAASGQGKVTSEICDSDEYQFEGNTMHVCLDRQYAAQSADLALTTSLQAVAGCSVTVNNPLSGSVTCEVEQTLDYDASATGYGVALSVIYLDGSPVASCPETHYSSASTGRLTASNRVEFSISSGNHTIAIYARKTSSGGTITARSGHGTLKASVWAS